MAKKKSPYLQRKQRNEFNKKAIIWTAAAFGFLVILMSVLLILD